MELNLWYGRVDDVICRVLISTSLLIGGFYVRRQRGGGRRRSLRLNVSR